MINPLFPILRIILHHTTSNHSTPQQTTDLYNNTIINTTSLPYFGVKLSCVCLMFAYKNRL